jgi:hypothetical protein
MMVEMSPFSEDYSTARDRFRHAAKSLGARVEAYPIGPYEPTGLDLSIDVAVVGPERPTRTILVTSGVHGVEGFFGSAVQVALLERSTLRNKLPLGTSVVLVHGLNAFGFAALRRFDAENVDLNRNFLLMGEEFAGYPQAYAELDPLLNPRRPPARFDPFRLQILAVIFRLGLGPLKEAVAGGQYEFPRGLFFGGKKASPTCGVVQRILVDQIGSAHRIRHIDFHTGLGRWADYRLLLVEAMNDRRDRFVRRFGPERLEQLKPEGRNPTQKAVAYEVRGDLITWCCRELFSDRDYDGIAAEFGTYGPIAVLTALRAENQAHHWATPDNPMTGRSKKRLREVFAPASPSWRSSTVAKGVEIVQRTIDDVDDKNLT